MKKMLCLLMALVFGVVPFTACSGTDEQSSDVTSEEESVTPAVKLRVGSYNIAHCRMANFDPKLIAEDIKAQDLDVVGIQEVDRFCSRSRFIDTAELLKEYTGFDYAYARSIDLAGDVQKYGQQGAYGTLILSRYPIKSHETVMLDSATYEQRSLCHAVIQVEGMEIDLFNTHLSYETPEIRATQFLQLAEYTKDKKHCILTGDFNVKGLEEFDVLSLDGVNKKDSPIITFPSTERAIDNVLYSSSFSCVSAYAVDTKHSDHCLLVTELEIISE